MRWPRALLATLCVGLAAGASSKPARAEELPEWVAAAFATATPEWASRSSAVILHDEQIIRVPASGRISIVTRGALRILSSSGAEEATCAARFLRGTSAITEMKAWLLEPNRTLRRFGRRDALDLSLAGSGALYSDARELRITPDGVRTGSAFAWEYEREEEPLLAQWRWFFQSAHPCLLSRISLTLPPGLEPAAKVFGREPLPPLRRDRTWIWEARDLPSIPSESFASTAWTRQASLTLDVRGASSPTAAGVDFAGWHDVAAWVGAIANPQARVSPELAARAAAIIAGGRDTLERLRALALAVRSVNYVSVDLGIGRGWGYRPHPAAEVLQLGYGDCKDKANLLVTLIRAAGMQAWIMPVYWGDREWVDERWPSPIQFNHCIVAMRVPRGTGLPAVFQRPGLGTLLAFDPTDKATAFGDLPGSQQGSKALLVEDGHGGLVGLPVAPPEADRLERRIDATLDQEGGLSAVLVERSVGQEAAAERRLRFGQQESEYRRMLESWLTAGAGTVNVRRYSAAEDTVSGRFRLEVAYDTPLFAHNVQSRLLVFRAALVSPRESQALPDSARARPIALEAHCLAETVIVKVPEGFELDERPEAIHRKSDFASLDATWSMEGGALRFTREWTLRPVTLPAERYSEVREFLGANLAATQSPVVFVRR